MSISITSRTREPLRIWSDSRLATPVRSRPIPPAASIFSDSDFYATTSGLVKQGYAPTGVLQSEPFQLAGGVFTFESAGAGGSWQIVDSQTGEVLHTYTFSNETMKPAPLSSPIDLSVYGGREVIIRLVDDKSGGWGHVSLDNLAYSDSILWNFENGDLTDVSGRYRFTAKTGSAFDNQPIRYAPHPDNVDTVNPDGGGAYLLRTEFKSAGFFETPTVIADIATENGSDPAVLRYQNLTREGIQIRIQEDTAYDTETSHTSETVDYFVLPGTSGFINGTSVTSMVQPTDPINNPGDLIWLDNEGNRIGFQPPLSYDLYGGDGSDRIYGGAGEDGILGDDGWLVTSRNGSPEPLYEITYSRSQSTLTFAGNQTGSVEYITGLLQKDFHTTTADMGSSDIIYGGLGDDFVHAGFGDDAILGGEAHAVVLQ